MITVRKACQMAQRGKSQGVQRCIERFLVSLDDPNIDVFSLLYSIYWDNGVFDDKVCTYQAVGHILNTPEIVSYFSRDDWFKGHYLAIIYKMQCPLASEVSVAS